MNFINNMSVSKRLYLLSFVSIVGMLILGLQTVSSTLKEKDTLEMVKSKTNEAEAFSKLIHELQIERGLTAGVIVSKGKKNIEKLRNQRENADRVFRDIQSVFVNSPNKHLLSAFSDTVSQNRSSVDSLSISLGDGTGYYTKTIGSFMEGVVKIPSMLDDKDIARAIQAYTHITSSKESLGRIRAILNGSFIKNEFIGKSYQKLIVNYGIIECNDHKFALLALPSTLELYNKNELNEDLIFVRSRIKSAINKPQGGFNVDASIWFTRVTNSINMYRDIERLYFSDINKMVNKKVSADNSKLVFTISLMAVLLIGVLFFSMLIGRNIATKVEKIQQGLFSFFHFLSKEIDSVEKIEDLGKDEFGRMSYMINERIEILEVQFSEQRQSIVEFDSICNEASKGFLFHRMPTDYSEDTLNRLSGSLNMLLDEVENTLTSLTGTLVNFAQGNYSDVTRNESIKGSYASIEQATISVATSNSEIFGIISKFSREFSQDANMLSESGDELSTSANEQASSLEETAAAIEELTSNVSANSAKAEEMTRVAEEAKVASEKGNVVAKESLDAMNEIVSATEAINKAVDTIDNIAFQTNILSLNAAVEAATAGDAGKGFAVVAQEVRNLANRSADAAKEIQELARIAGVKSQGGLDTSKNMMEGFALISDKIAQTDEMVKDVANASREQMAGIGQINDAVSQLDQMTQQNAKTANNVAQISNEILGKTDQFEQILSRVKFDERYEKQSCDIGMVFDTAKLKIDHINFKENNYKKLKSESTVWKVVDHHSCNLGKWIDTHMHEEFAKTPEWKELLSIHEKVHSGVQSLIHADKDNATVEEFDRISQELEHATVGVFNGLDNVKLIACSHN
jgi:methyl-accepting chemotaxis protein